MKPLFYIFKKTIKNHIKELKKKPGILILYIIFLALLIFMIISAFRIPQKSSVNGNVDVYGAIVSGTILTVVWFGVKNGIDKGSSFFRLSDVNLVFTAPISPTRVLVYGFIKQLSATFFFTFFLLFQIPNLRNFLSITGIGILIIFSVVFFLIFTMSILGLLTYSITSRSTESRNLAKKILNSLMIIGGLTLLYNVFVYKDFQAAAISLLNLKFFIYIPFIGWLKSILMAAVTGITYSFYIYIILCIAFVIIMIYVLFKMNTDYYEDVLAATDKMEEIIAMKKSGKGNINYGRKKFRKIKSGSVGSGASSIFHRHLLEYKKSGIPFIDKTTFIMIGMGIISRYFFKGANMNTILFFSIYMLFFFTLQGKWGQELSKPFIYLIPYSSISKLFYATLADLIKYTVDGLSLFIVSGVILKSGAVVSILCALCYASFGAIYTYSDVLSRKLLGETHSKNLQTFSKMGISLLVVLPGIITFAILSATTKYNSSMQYISYIILICYNLLASFTIMFLSKRIFEVLELD